MIAKFSSSESSVFPSISSSFGLDSSYPVQSSPNPFSWNPEPFSINSIIDFGDLDSDSEQSRQTIFDPVSEPVFEPVSISFGSFSEPEFSLNTSKAEELNLSLADFDMSSGSSTPKLDLRSSAELLGLSSVFSITSPSYTKPNPFPSLKRSRPSSAYPPRPPRSKRAKKQ